MSSRELHIRPAHHTDFPAIAAMMKDFVAQHHRWQPNKFRPAMLGFTAANLQSWLTRANEVHLIAECGGETAGYVSAIRGGGGCSSVTYPSKNAYVSLIVVAPDHRRLGIGSALFAAVESWAKAFDAESVGLNVSPFNNSAQEFYATLGYQPTLEFRAKTLRHVKRREAML